MVASDYDSHRSPRLCDLFQRRSDNGLWGESEFFLEFFQRRRCAESLHAYRAASLTDVSRPSESGALFYRNAGGDYRRQHVLAILRMFATVIFEDLPRGHTDDAGFDALGLEFLVGVD